MAMNVGTIYYEVASDTSKLVNGGTAADESLEKLEKTFKKTDAAAAKSQHQMTATAKAAKQLGDEAARASRPIDGMVKLLGGLLTIQGFNALIQMAEGYGEMAERIRFATASQEEYELVQKRLLETANNTYRSLAEAQEVYILTADALRSVGYNTEQAVDIVDSLSYSFVKNATSVLRSQSAISAFTKSVQSGRVAADSWQTIVAAAPSLIEDIAKASGRSTAEIREMGVAGKLTGQMLTQGLLKSLEANKEAAAGMATTVRDAFTNLRNNLTVFLGEMNMATGATSILSSSIIAVGNNIDFLAKSLAALAAGALAAYLAKTAVAVVETGRAMMAARALALEELNLARAHAAATAAKLAQAQATVGLGVATGNATALAAANVAAQSRLAAATAATTVSVRTLLGVLGGPAGLLFMLGSAAAAFLLFRDNASKAITPVEELTASIDKLGNSQLDLRAQKAADSVEALEKRAEQAAVATRGLEKDYAALAAQLGRGVSDKDLDNVRKTLVEQRAEQEALNEQLAKTRDVQRQISEEQKARKDNPVAAGAPAGRSDPEVVKRLAAMREELELAKLTGEARARLQAIQKLGENATAAERAEAEKLAAQIFRLEEARKKLSAATKQETKDTKQNTDAIAALKEELGQAALIGEALAVARAKSKLNKFATPEEIAEVERLAAAIWQVAESERIVAERNQKVTEKRQQADQLKLSVETPFETLNRELEELEKLTRENPFLNNETVRRLDAAAWKKFSDQFKEDFTALDEFTKRAAQNIQDYLGKGLFQLMEGNFDNIGDSFLKMLNRMIAESAAADLSKWLFGGMVQGGQGSGVLGSALSAVGSFFGFGGFRAGGGPVQAGKAYRMNELGRPEVLNVGARQFMIPTKSGTVDPNPSSVREGDSWSLNFYQPVSTQTANQAAQQVAMQQRRASRLSA